MDTYNSPPKDVRSKLRYALVSLEDKDLENQAHYGVKAIIDSLETVGDAIKVLKDMLGGLEGCSKHAVRARLTLAVYTIKKYAPTPGLIHAAPPSVKLLSACFGDPSNSELLCTIYTQLATLCLKSGNGYDNESTEWLSETFLHPLLRAAYRDPESHRAATACAVTQAVLQTLQVGDVRTYLQTPALVPLCPHTFTPALVQRRLVVMEIKETVRPVRMGNIDGQLFMQPAMGSIDYSFSCNLLCTALTGSSLTQPAGLLRSRPRGGCHQVVPHHRAAADVHQRGLPARQRHLRARAGLPADGGRAPGGGQRKEAHEPVHQGGGESGQLASPQGGHDGAAGACGAGEEQHRRPCGTSQSISIVVHQSAAACALVI